MLKKANWLLMGLLAASLSVPACGGEEKNNDDKGQKEVTNTDNGKEEQQETKNVAFQFKNINLYQAEAVYDGGSDEDGKGLSIYFLPESITTAPTAYAYIYLFKEGEETIAADSYSLDYIGSHGTTFFTILYSESANEGSGKTFFSPQGTFELTSIDQNAKLVKGKLKGVTVKEFNGEGLDGDAISIADVEVSAKIVSQAEFDAAHPEFDGE